MSLAPAARASLVNSEHGECRRSVSMNALASTGRALLRQAFGLSRSHIPAMAIPSRTFAVRAASKALKDRAEYAADATAEQKVTCVHFASRACPAPAPLPVVSAEQSTCLDSWRGCLVQAKALDGVIRDVNARFGKGSLMRMSATPEKV